MPKRSDDFSRSVWRNEKSSLLQDETTEVVTTFY